MADSRLSSTDAVGKPPRISFEFFPPKTPELETRLWDTVKRLEPLEPQYVSVTYGAGGSTRERTARTVARILQESGLEPAAHLTCVDATRDEVDAVIADFAGLGVRRFVALRGDPSAGTGTPYRPHPDGYENGADLVTGLKRIGDFDISVSAYPEKHPESPDFATDIDMLKRKVDNGATRAITQLFFDNDLYDRYVERVRRAGIDIPIVPGLLPIHSFRQVAGFAARCGASMPTSIADRLEGLEDDPQAHAAAAAELAAQQTLDLVARGVEEFHFYTMNRAELVLAVCALIGLGAREGAEAAA